MPTFALLRLIAGGGKTLIVTVVVTSPVPDAVSTVLPACTPVTGTCTDDALAGMVTVAGTVALVLGDDGGLGWRDQVQVSMLSNRLARLGQWFRENF